MPQGKLVRLLLGFVACLCAMVRPACSQTEPTGAKSPSESNLGAKPGYVDFKTSVAPVLQTHCLHCHYPGNEKGGISLATVADLEENGYLGAGSPDDSYLLELVHPSADGQSPSMPQDAEPLKPTELAILTRWIESGAPWPDEVVLKENPKADTSWWSLQPLKPGEPPAISFGELKGVFRNWNQPIDRYLVAGLVRLGLQPNSTASKEVLIRRAKYDLHGLPPSFDEIQEFVADEAPDAYMRLVDRLLAAPEYGERWGRHWLDVVRFGESTGYERNVIIDDAWPFRDYVINSLNDDKPFDQFVREHVAGDVLMPDDPEVKIASGFLVNGPYDNVGNQDAIQAAQIRANTIDEIIRANCEAFLGLTVGCARCHDHKFDPITQQDYYQLYATFAGIKHGSGPLATPQQVAARQDQLEPLQKQLQALNRRKSELEASIRERAQGILPELEKQWIRPAVDRRKTEESFTPIRAKFVRLKCERRDDNPATGRGFRIDEFEIWTNSAQPQNVALDSNGGDAVGPSRNIEDFPGAYAASLAIDGRFGARFISADDYLQVEIKEPVEIDRVVFSSAREEPKPEQAKFSFVADYRIETSLDGKEWTLVAQGLDRRPVSPRHREARAEAAATTQEDRRELQQIKKAIAALNSEISRVPSIPQAWIGSRDSKAAAGPFHLFLGGDPQRTGKEVLPASPEFLRELVPSYSVDTVAGEAERRIAFAQWLTDRRNALTARVIVNRLWHYHFGTGIVATPNDFGFMGAKPTHPELLDYLALQLNENGWHLKPIHRMIMLSSAYRQSSEANSKAMQVDASARYLWRYPPRRLSAEEIRDSMLLVSGQLNSNMYGPGFRLYRYLQDNVATYVPLDQHPLSTYRRSVYHQNARACNTDLFSDFDQPDCSLSTASRTNTTTPLQALTALNHALTLDLSQQLATQLQRHASTESMQAHVRLTYENILSRPPTPKELRESTTFVEQTSLADLCRVLLNTSEFIWIE